ncbi:MAG: cytochrome C oxidase subunit IV family protein [Candidatus Marinimicrobia bacterium]|nr:cytochrome C oxidase subunit IV family protein [Candidatus Neomarinimicrobiota bacterium]
MTGASSELDTHTRTYLAVFGALAILTVVTVTVGYLSLPVGAAIVVALSIASLKGALVASFFMHLISEQKPILWLLLLTLGLLLVLIFILVIAFYDHAGTIIVT